jgi:hypothetical protein
LCDRQLLGERFQHLVQQGRMVAELTEDFLAELALWERELNGPR